MPNAKYTTYTQCLLDPGSCAGGAAVDVNTDTMTISLHTTAYTFSAVHQDFADLTGQIDSQRETLGSVTVLAGVFDAANTVFTTVASGSTIARYIISKSTGVGANDQLLAYMDTGAAGAISLATNDGDVTIAHNASGILTI